jgi:hypothetical protein
MGSTLSKIENSFTIGEIFLMFGCLVCLGMIVSFMATKSFDSETDFIESIRDDQSGMDPV